MGIITNQEAVIWNPGEKEDRYGNKVDDWNNAIPTHVTDVSVQPTGTQEVVDDQQTTVADWHFYCEDPDVASILQEVLRATSRIECDGQTYEVVGAPQMWPDPLEPGAINHVEAPLRVFDPNPRPEE